MSDLPEHQNAIALDEFGGPERLTLHQISVPEPRDDEVLIRVHTAGIGVWDPSEREGGMAELMDEKPTFPYVLGSDGSGVVARVGDDVDVFSEGDAVWASHFLNPRGGFYSEYVPVKAEYAAPLPDGLSMTEAGAMPADAVTAYRGLRDTLELEEGETVAVFGASGGVGHLAVQLARRLGARVLAVASGNDGRDLARELGADEAVRGRAHELEEPLARNAPNGLDAALICAHGEGIEDVLSAVRRGGRIAWPNGVRPEPEVPAGVSGASYDGAPEREILDELTELIGSDPFRVVVDERFPLADAAEAHRRLDDHYLGKLTLAVEAES